MYTPSRLHKKISIYTIMDPSTETNIPVEVVPVAEPESVEPVAEPVPEPVVEPVPEPAVEVASEAVPEPVAEPVVEPVAEPVPEPASEAVPEPVAEPVPEPEVDSPNVLDLSDYTTPEYLEMVKKLIEPSEIETETVEMSKKTFKIPGYTSIQLSNTSKQPRRKSMTFM